MQLNSLTWRTACLTLINTVEWRAASHELIDHTALQTTQRLLTSCDPLTVGTPDVSKSRTWTPELKGNRSEDKKYTKKSGVPFNRRNSKVSKSRTWTPELKGKQTEDKIIH